MTSLYKQYGALFYHFFRFSFWKLFENTSRMETSIDRTIDILENLYEKSDDAAERAQLSQIIGTVRSAAQQNGVQLDD